MASRGQNYLLRLAASVDEGINSLFGVFRFPDPAAKQIALRHDVSVQTSEELTDGKNNTYKEALEHVALTNYPVVPGMMPWEPMPGDQTGLVYRKELLPEGPYYKASEDLGFDISPEYLEKLVNNFSAMQINGVSVPLQLTHEGDGNKHGDLIGTYIAKRPKTPATKEIKDVPVSLSLSHRNSLGAAIMTLDELAALLGIAFTPEMDDVAKAAAVKAKLQEVLQSVAASNNPPAQQQVAAAQPPNPQPQLQQSAQTPQPQQQQSVPMQQPLQGLMSPMQQTPAGTTVAAQLPTSVQVKFSQPVVSMLRKGRIAELEALVAEGCLTPAAKDEAIATLLADGPLKLSLSRADDDKTPDAFEQFVQTMKKNKGIWSPNGRTQIDSATGQQLSLSGHNAQNQSPLMADRLKRVQREKQRAGNVA